eukprot:jgi/Galph1/4018/GphlegSOOS_G2660.1
MSRPSFRPRPIDLNRPLQIIRSYKDFPVQEELLSTRGLPVVETGVDPSEQEERHLQQALLASLLKDERRKHEIEIPVPVVHERCELEVSSVKTVHRPKEYIQEVNDDISSFLVLYEATEADEDFVSTLNANTKDFQLTLSDFEVVIDRLERLQGTESELLSFSQMKEGLRSLRDIPDYLKEEIYKYWLKLRKERTEPLLRIFRKPPSVDDPNPALAFRPREHEYSTIRGTENTYEAYKKAVRMRRDFEKLRMIVEQVVKRERLKREHLSYNIILCRLAVAQINPKMAMVIRQSCSNENDLVSIYDRHLAGVNGSDTGRLVMIPLTGIHLPPDIRKVLFGGRGGVDRSKKQRKRKRPAPNSVHLELDLKKENMDSMDVLDDGFDELGFDEAGQRFIKNMKYFSGNFASNGVNPYDYRVFEAAARRNTAKNLRDSYNIRLPNDVPFCSPVSHWKLENSCFRGRLGRGGRIVFDRVIENPNTNVCLENFSIDGNDTQYLPIENVAKSKNQQRFPNLNKLSSR